MWINFWLLLMFVPFTFGLETDAVQLAVDYFNYRNVSLACLLTCKKDNLGSHKYSQNSIAVSKVHIGNFFTNLDAIEECLNQEYTSVGVVVDPNCPRFEEVLQFASSKMLFSSMHKWIIIDDDLGDGGNYTDESFVFTNTSWVSVIEDIETSVDSDIVLCIQEGLQYSLYEAFNFGKIQGGKLIIEYVGYWKQETGFTLNINLNDYKYYRRWDFNQWSMRMIVVISNPAADFVPEMVADRRPAPGVAVITQTSAMILNVVAENHNFKYNYTIADRWIGDFSSRSTKVVADSLYFRTQDISPVIRFMPDIYKKIDVVQPPLTAIETRYYYRIPTYGPGKFENQFLRPLTNGAWGCVGAVIALCAVTLLLSAFMERRPMPAQYAVFSVLSSFCQQFFEDGGDYEITRRSVARKIAVLVTGLACLLIYNYYTSSVVSWLLNGPPPSINSLEELLESPLELIYEDIGYTRSWLQIPSYYYNKRNEKVEDEMRKRKVLNKRKDALLLMPVNDGIEMVKAGGYAYHTEVNSANMLISRKFTQMELCELGSLQSMEKTELFPAVQKRSPYREFFIWSLLRLKERGIVSCIRRRTESNSVACEGSSPRALALGGAAPAFLLLVFGYLLATGIMLLERFVYNHYQRRF